MRKVFFIVATTFLLCGVIAPVNGESCRQCHEKEQREWQHSKHALAMAPATTPSVLADFDDVEFVHVGFDDVIQLSDAEIKSFLDLVETKKMFGDYAWALLDAKPGLAEKLKRLMTETQRGVAEKEIAFQKEIGFARPGDIAAAQNRLISLLQTLAEQNIINVDFAERARFSKKKRGDGNDVFFVTVLGNEGKPVELQVEYVIGIYPLQQYIVTLPTDADSPMRKGRLQCLPYAWNINQKRWFHLYPKEPILSDDPLHWTKPLQNWNMMCADCHTTNFRRNFNVKTNSYSSKWDEDGVGCSACHGVGIQCRPVRETLSQATSAKSNFFSLSNATQTESIDSCAACHTRRRYVTDGPKQPETPLLDAFVPEILDNHLYFPDGQLLEENFEYSSFMQSLMYSKGVTCTNCHNAHTAKLKFEGNRLCAQCHSPGIYDTADHHFHPNEKKLATASGTQCVECHLPEVKYMVVDPRHDHSIRKPNPDLTLALGVPNACNICHRNSEQGESATWAKETCDRWYTEKRKSTVGYSAAGKPLTEHYGLAIAAGRKLLDQSIADKNIDERQKRVAEVVSKLKIVATNTNLREFRPLVRASAIAQLARIGTPEALAVCNAALSDAEPLIRWHAIDAAQSLTPQERLGRIGTLLEDPVRAIRAEAGRSLAMVPPKTMTPEQRKKLEAAIAEYVASQNVSLDQAASHLNLAVTKQNLVQSQIDEVTLWFNASMSDAKQTRADQNTIAGIERTYNEFIRKLTAGALDSYETSIRIDPDFVPSRLNLAMLFDLRNEPVKAEEQIRAALKINPEFGDAAYSLALLLSQQQRLVEAEVFFRKAAELLPGQMRLRYNWSLVLFHLDKVSEAKSVLREALRFDPTNEDFLNTLRFFDQKRH